MTTLQIVLVETLMRPKKLNGATTRWRPALMNSEYEMVWRGSLYLTADEAKAVATKQQGLTANFDDEEEYDEDTNPDGVDTYHAWDCNGEQA